ncbi:MAG: hypothetical protein GEU80_15895 [Dehalococcoidia bacterium]|nr:hypothetical protein [Dehalococcoidia bacterium]
MPGGRRTEGAPGARGGGAIVTALEGVLAVEVGGSPASRFAARLLAAGGARVIRIAPHGQEEDSLRRRAEHRAYDAGVETVRYEHPAEFEPLLRAALEYADVVIDSRDGAEAAPSSSPSGVHVRVTPFGRTGPLAGRPASDLTLQAYGGFLWLSGHPEREPVKAALDQVHLLGGRVAAFLAVAGLYGGRAVRFDVGLAEVAASIPPFHIQQYTHAGAIAGRGPAVEAPLDGQHVPTEDGYVTFATGNTPHEMFAALFDDESLVDERFATPDGRAQHRAALEAAVHTAAAGRAKRELFERAMSLNIVAGMVQTVDDLLACSQLAKRGALATDADGMRLPGAGFAAEGLLSPSVPPRTIDVAGALSALASHRPAPRRQHGSPDAPLAGLTMLSFEDVIALPWATVQMARLGARVVRVESRSRLQSRHWGVFPDNQPSEEYWNEGANHAHLYRRKESLAVDLASSDGVSAIRRILPHVDAVLENFRPGVLERLGLGPDVIREANPGALLLRSSGYGQTGPYRSMGAFARTIDAMSGLTDLTGYVDGPPQRANPSFMDTVSAWNIALATVLGLVERERTGRGPTIDHSMYEAGVSTVAVALAERQLGGDAPRRRGNGDPDADAQEIFETADGRLIALTLRDHDDRSRLARALGCDEVLATEPVGPSLKAIVRRRNAFELEAALTRADVAASVVRDSRDVLLEPHLHERGAFDWVRTRRTAGDYVRPYPAIPFGSSSSGSPEAPADHPRLGEHNAAVLRDLAGLPLAKIESLARLGVTGTEPVAGAAPRPRPLNVEIALARRVVTDSDAGYAEAVEALRRRVR